MGILSKHKDLAVDPYSVGSKKKLKASVEHKMKRIYTGILDAIEEKMLNGDISRDIFDTLRTQVLNVGNHEIRNIRKELDERYNVEFVNYHIVMQVRPLEGYPDAVVEGNIYEG